MRRLVARHGPDDLVPMPKIETIAEGVITGFDPGVGKDKTDVALMVNGRVVAHGSVSVSIGGRMVFNARAGADR